MREQFVNQPLVGTLSREFFENLARSAQRSEFFVPGQGLAGIRTQSFAADLPQSPVVILELRIVGAAYKEGLSDAELTEIRNPTLPYNAVDSGRQSDPLIGAGISVLANRRFDASTVKIESRIDIPIAMTVGDGEGATRDVKIQDVAWLGRPLRYFSEGETLSGSGANTAMLSNYDIWKFRAPFVEDEPFDEAEAIPLTGPNLFPVVVNHQPGQFLIHRYGDADNNSQDDPTSVAREGDVVTAVWSDIAQAFVAINPPTRRFGRIVGIDMARQDTPQDYSPTVLNGRRAYSPFVVQIYQPQSAVRDAATVLNGPVETFAPTHVFCLAYSHGQKFAIGTATEAVSGDVSSLYGAGPYDYVVPLIGDWVVIEYWGGTWHVSWRSRKAERIHFQLVADLTDGDATGQAAIGEATDTLWSSSGYLAQADGYYRGLLPSQSQLITVSNRRAGCLQGGGTYRWAGDAGCRGTAEYDDRLDCYWIDDIDCICSSDEQQSGVDDESSSGPHENNPGACCGATPPVIGDLLSAMFANVAACICAAGSPVGGVVTMIYVGTGLVTACDGTDFAAGPMKWVFRPTNGTFVLQATCAGANITLTMSIICCQADGDRDWSVTWGGTAANGSCKFNNVVLAWISSIGIACAGATSTVTINNSI